MIESILLFLMSPVFVSVLGALSAVLAIVAGFLKGKNTKAEKMVNILVQGVELANSKDTKDAIKSIAVGYDKFQEAEFFGKIDVITSVMKKDKINSLRGAVDTLNKIVV